jgi:hypothetical protein
MSVKVVDTRHAGGDAPIWLLAVVEVSSGPTAMVAIEPQTAEVYEHVHTRMRRGGFTKVTRREWDTSTWALSTTAAVDVVHGDLVRITTGAASIYTAGPMPVSAGWLEAARCRRVLVALVVPGTLGLDGTSEQKQQRLADLVDRRQLVGTMAPARFNLPVRRPS